MIIRKASSTTTRRNAAKRFPLAQPKYPQTNYEHTMNTHSRLHPFQNLTSNDLQREINRFFDNFLTPSKGTETRATQPREKAWKPVIDVRENSTNYMIDVELPGVTKEEVTLSFHDNTLTISGERKQSHEEKAPEEEGEKKQWSYHRTERFYGKFQRAFTFPSEIDPDNITAAFQDGILSIQIPKAEAARPRQIVIS
ncbi:MAG: Hsp20/alpha crystallin family protein [Armatimonadetes bacterium]|nr:Hsp20/alpha crystallin family protein [Armatimonadota bacterium]